MTHKRLYLALSLLLGLAACTSVDSLPAGGVSGEEIEQQEETEQKEAGSQPESQPESKPESKPESSADSIEEQLESAIASDGLDTSSQPSTRPPNAVSQSGEVDETDETGDLSLESDCQTASTQVAINQCAQQAYKVADTRLNRAYQSLKTGLSGSAAQALTTTELAWIAFRDLDCTFISDQYEGGSIEPLIHSDCLRERTQTRTAEIQKPELPGSSYQAADSRLNEQYQVLLGRLSGSQKQEIADVQLAWIKYRDRNCDFEVLYSANVIEETQCLARMSETRAAELQDIAEQRNL